MKWFIRLCVLSSPFCGIDVKGREVGLGFFSRFILLLGGWLLYLY